MSEPHQRWTQTDITELRRRLSAGEAQAEVATAMGRTGEAVGIMMKRLRLPAFRPADGLPGSAAFLK